MQQLPLPLQSAEFAAAQCVGVLTYVPDTGAILRNSAASCGRVA